MLNLYRFTESEQQRKGGDTLRTLKISLKAARVNAGLKQDDVAKEIRKTKQTIVNWETGRREIDRANFEALCRLYSVTVDDILLPIRFTLSEQANKAVNG